jgi:hypothetical protein
MLTTSLSRLGVLAASLCWLAGGLAAEVQTTLRWKFKEGEKISYSMEMKQQSKTNIGGMQIDGSMLQAMEFTWTVKSVGDDGSAELIHTFDRLRMKIEAPPPVGEFEFDSKEGKEPEGQLAQVIGPILTELVGAEISLKRDALGKGSDVKLPAKLADALRVNPFAGAMGPMFTEDGLKAVVAQLGVPVPEEAVKKGSTWDHTMEVKTPFGVTKEMNTYTYQGQDDKKLEKFDVNSEHAVEPAPEALFEVKLKAQESKGTIYFDNAVGRVTELQAKQKLSMELNIMGNVIEQDQETTVTVKLAGGEKNE